MKNTLLFATALLFLFSCKNSSNMGGVSVTTMDELNRAIAEAEAGSTIVLANGVWENAQIQLYGKGTEAKPIILRAETAGEVFLEGQSSVHLGGEHLVVDGLYFRNGYAPKKCVIRYQIGKDSTAFHTRVTNCVIEDFTRPSRLETDRWVEFYGQHNQLDHCYIAGKGNDGATLVINHRGNQHTNNHHQIVYNYFGPRPRKGGPHGETMRIGGSETSMTPGHANISNNYFEACNGEVEIISDKTRYNTFKNNIFYKCEGSLVMRHADYAVVDGNMFIGGDDSDFYGGIRAVNSGHWITNNYFYKIRGEEFRSPLAIMNGIPKSSLNRYKQVTDVVVAYNTWVDCKSPFQIGVGQNKASADVLPKSEIRSAPPIRTTIANNLIYNSKADAAPIVNHDDISGITFKNNIIDNQGGAFENYGALETASVRMKQVSDWLFVPETDGNARLDSSFIAHGFDDIKTGLFGAARGEKSRVGAINSVTAAEQFKIDKSQYGPAWFSVEKAASKASILSASSAKGELAKRINEAKSGDIIELSDAVYMLETPLKIDKKITLRAKGESKAQLVYTGAENIAAFEMNPKGSISLKNIALKGQNKQMVFAPSEKNTNFPYKMSLDDCEISDFSYVLKASNGSFADSIYLHQTTIQNCQNGFVLAAEKKGDYNAEMFTIDNCTFKNVQQNVIHFYRGGYDESTIGGFLRVFNSTFTGCGRSEKSGVLLKTRGIINVHLFDNTFTNNPVKLVALLWGAKNNVHRDNTVQQSGKIEVQEQQKLELMY